MRSRRWWPPPPKPKPVVLTDYDRAVLRSLKDGPKVAENIPADSRDRLFRGEFIHYTMKPSPKEMHFGALVDWLRISERGKIELELEDMKRQHQAAQRAEHGLD